MTSHARLPGLRQAQRSQAAQQPPSRQATPPAAEPQENKTTGLVYLAVLACAAGGLLLAWRSAGGVRWGAVLAGGALVAGAVARIALPTRLAGMLASRHRYLDASMLAGLGLGMAVIGLLLPPPT